MSHRHALKQLNQLDQLKQLQGSLRALKKKGTESNHGTHTPSHTPGPWKYDTSGGQVSIISEADGDRTGVAQLTKIEFTTYQHASKELQRSILQGIEANARLIAAAPEMYAMLQQIYKTVDLFDDPQTCRVIRDLLTRIEGGGTK